MDKLKRIVMIGLVLSPVLTVPAWAASLDDLKAQGLVGERFDGYLGFPNPDVPGDVRSTASGINAKRMQKYQSVAHQNGTSVRAVELLMGEKLISRAAPGEYVLPKGGNWIRK